MGPSVDSETPFNKSGLVMPLLSIRTAQVTVADSQLNTSEGEHSKHRRKGFLLSSSASPSTQANTDLKKQWCCQRTRSRQRCQQTLGNHRHQGGTLWPWFVLGFSFCRSWEPEDASDDALGTEKLLCWL